MEKLKADRLGITETSSSDVLRSYSLKGEIAPQVAEIALIENQEIRGFMDKFSPRLKKIILTGIVSMTFIAGGMTREAVAEEEKNGKNISAKEKFKDPKKQVSELWVKKAKMIRAQRNGEMTWHELEIKCEDIDNKIKKLQNIQR